jgi:hypothetical protein
MQPLAEQLEAWRREDRRRGLLVPGSEEWVAADEAWHEAQALYRGQAAQAFAQYAELEFAAQDRLSHGWFGPAHVAAAVRELDR